MQEYRAAILTATAVLVLVLFFFFWGSLLLPIPDAIGGGSGYGEGSIELIVQALDQVTTMLTGLSLGFVVLIGFSLRVGDKNVSVSLPEMVMLLAFGVALLVSLFFGYGVRLRTIEYLIWAESDFLALRSIVSSQALWVAISSIPGAFIVARGLNRNAGKSE